MAQMNPQLVALLMAMQNNPNAVRGGPVLGGHPGQQTVNNSWNGPPADPMGDANIFWPHGASGGDGAATPAPQPGDKYGGGLLGGEHGQLPPRPGHGGEHNFTSLGPVLGGHPGQQTVNNGLPGADSPYAGQGPPMEGMLPPWYIPPGAHGGTKGGDGASTEDQLPEGTDPNFPWHTTNSKSLLGPQGTNIAGLLAGMNAITSPGQYNPRHPLTLMRQVNPGLISQPTKSGGSFGTVDQAATTRQNVLHQMMNK